MNVKFMYQYRDADNYKNNNEEIFSNDTGLSLEAIREQIDAALIEGEWFHVGKWRLPDLHFEHYSSETDHDYHEFIGIEDTHEQPARSDITIFLSLIRLEK